MSRIGKQPVKIPDGVKVTMKGCTLSVEGKNGKLDQWIDPAIAIDIDGDAKEVRFTRTNELRRSRAMHGLYRVLVGNMIHGIEKGFEKSLSIIGVGYNAKLLGKKLVLQMGFCHPVEMEIPEGLSLEVPNQTSIIVKGRDKQLVGQFAANIRSIRPPEPYKGKGIRYTDEAVQRKERKSLGA
ncbi:MAG: 50S ribosomal protein L6 [Planctomycetes bacterium]|nr:50S ribosomal protein L6 [Planctomycetota bacterium]